MFPFLRVVTTPLFTVLCISNDLYYDIFTYLKAIFQGWLHSWVFSKFYGQISWVCLWLWIKNKLVDIDTEILQFIFTSMFVNEPWALGLTYHSLNWYRISKYWGTFFILKVSKIKYVPDPSVLPTLKISKINWNHLTLNVGMKNPLLK